MTGVHLNTAEHSDRVCSHCGHVHPPTYTHCPLTGKPVDVGSRLVGHIFANRYRVISLLSEGGMGAVYLAEHVRIGRRVALKRLHPELACNARAVARFQREARAAAATLHDNIIDIFDLGYDEDGTPFLVMEYLRGESLADLLEREMTVEPKRLCFIMGQVLDALEAVHRKQIIHRDLKPDNVFLTARNGIADFIKILDFGVSKIRTAQRDALDLTQTGVMVGTPYYMSPEQAKGHRHLDHRIDIYAVGVMMYEALSGRMPFDGNNYHALLHKITSANPMPLSSVAPNVPPELSAVVHKAISRDREQRFDSATHMFEALLPFGASLEVFERAASSMPISLPSISAPPGFYDAPLDSRVQTRQGVGPRLATLTQGQPGVLGIDLMPAPEGVWTEPPTMRGGRSSQPLSCMEEATRPDSGYYASYLAAMPPSLRDSKTAPLDGTITEKTPMRDPDARIRGTLVRAIGAYAQQYLGNEASLSLSDAILCCDEEATLRQDQHEWVAEKRCTTLLDSLEKKSGRHDGRIVQRIGMALADAYIPERHAELIAQADPQVAVKHIPQLWQHYHSAHHIDLQPIREGHWKIFVRELPSRDRVYGWAVSALYRVSRRAGSERAGASSLRRCRARCLHQSDLAAIHLSIASTSLGTSALSTS